MLLRPIAFGIALVLVCSLAFAAAPTTSNPLLREWTGPYGGVPPFDQVKVEEFKPALLAAMEQHLEEVDAIANRKDAPTFDNTIAALERSGQLATTGPYAYVRHPQYVGFVLVMFGFLLQWPTLLTLAMFPVLVWMYVRLARQEEREVMADLGDTYRRYAARVPAFIPRFAKAADAQRG